MDLAKALRILRAARKLSQVQLAQLSGLTDPGFISLLENGERRPSMETLLKLSKAFDVQPWVILFLAEGKPDRSQPLNAKAMWTVLEEMLK